jgi:nitronate monooxygenase/enoyl-[acyl-carrier protein] reductase II
MPPFTIPQVGPAFAPRALRTPLIEQLESQPDTVDPAVAGPAAVAAIKGGGGEEFLPFAGQSVGLIRDVVPARELVHDLLAQAEAALERGARLVRA